MDIRDWRWCPSCGQATAKIFMERRGFYVAYCEACAHAWKIYKKLTIRWNGRKGD